jgi:hypothetical protein
MGRSLLLLIPSCTRKYTDGGGWDMGFRGIHSDETNTNLSIQSTQRPSQPQSQVFV